MTVYENGVYTGERALFATNNAEIRNSVFENGESPLKESSNLFITGCRFSWKYPLWYCHGVVLEKSKIEQTARSGIWYTSDIKVSDCEISSPKTFRRATGISLFDVSLPNAEETMWSCSDITLRRVEIRGDYFGMNCNNVDADALSVEGNYIFDGAKNVTVRNSRLISKDSFWNCENVTVYDSYIDGEYIGWNSKNVKFVNCTILSNQGLCYMENLVMENCRLINTDLAFEYSTVNADIISHIDSVKNPISGRIVADSIGEIIHESERVDVSLCEISVREK